MNGAELITEERTRQITVEGWTEAHDDAHHGGALYAAAVCYMEATDETAALSWCWPWHSEWWKPTGRLRNLVKAGALLIAERERFGRMRSLSRPWPPIVELPFLIEGVAVEIDRLLRPDVTDQADGIKRIDITEFRAEGYLQEVNRRVLHPLGLALEVMVEADGSERLGGVWDYRDDPEGMNYGGDYAGPPMAEKAAVVAALWMKREPARRSALGYMVQPFDGAADEAEPT